MTNDMALVRHIEEALLHDPRVSKHRIDVKARDGIVTLSGSVQTYRRKLVAEEVAASFHDCRGVRNDLVIEPAEHLQDDHQTAEQVRAALDAQADIVKETITVSVTNGVVVLAGTAASSWERDLALDVAIGVRGVREVKNLLLVDPVEQVDAAALADKIEKALGQARRLKNVPVRVGVNGGHVVLSGEVPELQQKEIAERVARRFGPLWIHNEIVVTGDAAAS